MTRLTRLFNFKNACRNINWSLIKHDMRMLCGESEKSSKLTVKTVLTSKPINQNVIVQGWIRSLRKHKKITFFHLGDGSCLENLQVVVDSENENITFGSSVKVEGTIVKSTHKMQDVELQCKSLTVLGECDPAEYPFEAFEDHSLKHTRKHLHLRPRTKRFAALLRIRSSVTFAIHKFLQEKEFFHVNSPIITSNDCEGGGDIFSVWAIPKKESDEEKSNSEYYFDVPAYLSVSGQLSLEAAACALSKVYTFSPAFRAENTRTRHHLSEFQMVEIEQTFIEDLEDLLSLTEELFKVPVKWILETNPEDVKLYHQDDLNPKYDEFLKKILETPFIRMSYSEAVDIIQKSEGPFKNSVKWGEKLLSEHENYILKFCNDIPVFLTDYPVDIAPFYMKKSTDKTVSCFDLIAPYGGEICGGSLREDDINELKSNVMKNGLDLEVLNWYIDLRKFGSVPHGGFGMGFDRYLQTILGVHNIREVVPFPRWTHHLQM